MFTNVLTSNKSEVWRRVQIEFYFAVSCRVKATFPCFLVLDAERKHLQRGTRLKVNQNHKNNLPLFKRWPSFILFLLPSTADRDKIYITERKCGKPCLPSLSGLRLVIHARITNRRSKLNNKSRISRWILWPDNRTICSLVRSRLSTTASLRAVCSAHSSSTLTATFAHQNLQCLQTIVHFYKHSCSSIYPA